MQARLFCRTGETKGELHFATEATIGRHPDNTLVLSPKHLSAHHARIAYEAASSCYVLEDLGSTTGTALDGEPISAPERLGHLHVITFAGAYDFVFQDLERCAARHKVSASAAAAAATTQDVPPQIPHAAVPPAAAQEAKTELDDRPLEVPSFIGKQAASGEKTMMDEMKLEIPSFVSKLADSGERTIMEELPLAVPSFLTSPPAASDPPQASSEPGVRCYLVVSESEGVPRRVRLVEGDNLVGRDADAVVRLESPSISRRHAVLTVAAGKVTVRDSGSRNHTFLDGAQVTGTAEVPAKSQLFFGAVGAKLDIERS